MKRYYVEKFQRTNVKYKVYKDGVVSDSSNCFDYLATDAKIREELSNVPFINGTFEVERISKEYKYPTAALIGLITGALQLNLDKKKPGVVRFDLPTTFYIVNKQNKYGIPELKIVDDEKEATIHVDHIYLRVDGLNAFKAEYEVKITGIGEN